ncbi:MULTISPECIES: hypothetical protein [unclassified Fusibacter]|uniref:hypothetical protein n=1 Tax=unclassified Fusibacter TaxID=2624464 RepID=UPI001013040B|nr:MULTISPECIES: hypothetical protein [unclassified Fusibacter]MCK8058633.1 hypothetical protein [Fusibacter sp. A2]NPE21708.1 hypothetical protein [Fusibacter sp. A1]RXV61283.1 hypothetical protein DWB64_07675 [Fusibacter sp. A1]
MEKLTVGQLFDRAMDWLRKHLTSLIIFNLGYYVVAFIVLYIFLLIFTIATIATSSVSSFGFGIGTKLMIAVLVIFVHAVVLNGKVGIAKIASSELTLKTVKASEAIGSTFKHTFKTIGLVTVMDLPLIVVLWVFAEQLISGNLIEEISLWVEVFIASFNDTFFGTVVFAIALTLGILLLNLLMAAYLVWFTFAIYEMCLENQSIKGAIKRSFKLVKVRYKSIYLITILILLTQMTIQYGINGIGQGANLISQFAGEILPLDQLIGLQAIVGLSLIIGFVANFISGTFGALASLSLYWQVRVTHDGYDLSYEAKKLQIQLKKGATNEQVL